MSEIHHKKAIFIIIDEMSYIPDLDNTPGQRRLVSITQSPRFRQLERLRRHLMVFFAFRMRTNESMTKISCFTR